MKALLWRIVAFILSREPIASWIIHIAKRTPYAHIYARHDPTLCYMRRYWLFNPYRKDEAGEQLPARWPWLPSVRVHHILRADNDLHLHNHPWDARTIILHGGYIEEVDAGPFDEHFPGYRNSHWSMPNGPFAAVEERSCFLRQRGYTGALTPDSFHRISAILPGGVVTLFFTWGLSQGWGFKVGERVVPWKEYLK